MRFTKYEYHYEVEFYKLAKGIVGDQEQSLGFLTITIKDKNSNILHKSEELEN